MQRFMDGMPTIKKRKIDAILKRMRESIKAIGGKDIQQWQLSFRLARVGSLDVKLVLEIPYTDEEGLGSVYMYDLAV